MMLRHHPVGTRHAARTLAATVFALILVVGLGLLVEGCSSDGCSVEARFANEPTSSLECASGTLCYRGECVTACTAGRERSEACMSNDDCSATRPECVDGFCSACAPDERCIPLIDVCQRVTEIPLPPEPDRPNPDRPLPPQPRDAGILDPGLSRRPDAGAMGPARPRPVSHVVFVDLGQEVNLIGEGTQGSTAAVRAFDVQGNPPNLSWRPDVVPMAIERTVRTDRDCEINELRTATVAAPLPISFGRVVVDDFEMSGAFPARNLEAEWDEGARAYALTPRPLPDQLLTLSDFDTLDSTFVSVTGAGADTLTDGTWPNPPTGLHVPFDLRPEPATRALLSSVVVIGQFPTRDLTFRWARVGTGVVATERVIARITGQTHELSCRQLEGPNTPGEIVITAGLLEDFLQREGAPAGSEYPLVFERASAEQLQVDPDVERRDVLRHFVSVRVRHSYVGRVQF